MQSFIVLTAPGVKTANYIPAQPPSAPLQVALLAWWPFSMFSLGTLCKLFFLVMIMVMMMTHRVVSAHSILLDSENRNTKYNIQIVIYCK